ncbi:MAG: Notchless protein 1, partial [Paramarteilia canceri]
KKEDDDGAFSFYIDGIEVSETIMTTIDEILKINKSNQTIDTFYEDIVMIEYREEASFSVTHASRCSYTNQEHEEVVIDLKFSPDGQYLASGSGDKKIRIWDCKLNTTIKVCDGHSGWIMCLKWAPDGLKIASGCEGGDVFIWSRQGMLLFSPKKVHK